MKRTSLLFTFAVVGVFGLLSTAFMGCGKNDDPSTALIRVLDTNGRNVIGATVRVYCVEDLCIIDDTSFSDANGESEHEFELPAVLKVQAWKEIATRFALNDSQTVDTTYELKGEAWVRLEEHERVVQQVTVFGNNLQ